MADGKEKTTVLLYTIEYSGELEGHRSKYCIESGQEVRERKQGHRPLEKSGDTSRRIIGKGTRPRYARVGGFTLDRDRFFGWVDDRLDRVEWQDEEIQTAYEEWQATDDE